MENDDDAKWDALLSTPESKEFLTELARQAEEDFRNGLTIDTDTAIAECERRDSRLQELRDIRKNRQLTNANH